ncbi:hypothetical protein TNCV_3197341 [Trichonephila clavipes]|nr:hypothetical protein TNCV_3197341 [Trichonephila clavipes]
MDEQLNTLLEAINAFENSQEESKNMLKEKMEKYLYGMQRNKEETKNELKQGKQKCLHDTKNELQERMEIG